MEKSGYTHLTERRRTHVEMIKQERMLSFNARLEEDLHRFLGNWLIKHILLGITGNMFPG